jgi:hypothetical protein
MQRKATLHELREAIDQIHACHGGEVLEVVEVTPPAASGSGAIRVHVFELTGHGRARRCSVWPEYPDSRTMIIHAVLHMGSVTCAAEAVRARTARLATRASDATTASRTPATAAPDE